MVRRDRQPGRGICRIAVGATLGFLVLAGCDRRVEQEPVEARFVASTFSALRGWNSDRTEAALPALVRSCQHLFRQPPTAALSRSPVGGTVADWLPVCREIAALPENSGQLRAFLEARFQPVQILAGNADTGLFTGYFEPEIPGSRTPATTTAVPLLRRPADLVHVELVDWGDAFTGQRIAGRVVDGRLQPFWSRAEIEAGALRGRVQPLVWVDDPVDAFFLHIQGSGRVRLADGDVVRVGYDGQNGHVYYPIGRYLIETGELEREAVSLQSIRDWLHDHPERKHAVMNRNPSYIFFRETGNEGPVGTQGTVLTPGRSLAVDRTVVPLGAPLWVDIDYADSDGRPLQRLMVAQDTGGAIRGPVRGDVFWGSGTAAESLAGPMKARGRHFVLLPRPLADRVLD